MTQSKGDESSVNSAAGEQCSKLSLMPLDYCESPRHHRTLRNGLVGAAGGFLIVLPAAVFAVLFAERYGRNVEVRLSLFPFLSVASAHSLGELAVILWALQWPIYGGAIGISVLRPGVRWWVITAIGIAHFGAIALYISLSPAGSPLTAR